MMNKVKFKINDKTLKGTLDFSTICNIHSDLEENGIECAYQEIFYYISSIEKLDTEEGHIVLASFLIHSLSRGSNKTEEYIAELFNNEKLDSIDDIILSFQNRFDYISKLFKKCMPLKESDSEFEDEDVYISKKDNWDFANMEYFWYTILKRSDDFYKATPKQFFNQMDYYNSINSKEKIQKL